jgi:hypothetical protein
MRERFSCMCRNGLLVLSCFSLFACADREVSDSAGSSGTSPGGTEGADTEAEGDTTGGTTDGGDSVELCTIQQEGGAFMCRDSAECVRISALEVSYSSRDERICYGDLKFPIGCGHLSCEPFEGYVCGPDGRGPFYVGQDVNPAGGAYCIPEDWSPCHLETHPSYCGA